MTLHGVVSPEAVSMWRTRRAGLGLDVRFGEQLCGEEGDEFRHKLVSSLVTPKSRYLRLIDSCITQLKAHGPSRTCNESNEEEEACEQATLADYVGAPLNWHFPRRCPS